MIKLEKERCGCGGRLICEESHGRIWVCCDTCSPVTKWAAPKSDNRRTDSATKSDEAKNGGL